MGGNTSHTKVPALFMLVTRRKTLSPKYEHTTSSCNSPTLTLPFLETTFSIRLQLPPLLLPRGHTAHAHKASPVSLSSNKMATKLYVGNLPDEAKEKDLRDLFQAFGDVSEVAILRGYGFVVSL